MHPRSLAALIGFLTLPLVAASAQTVDELVAGGRARADQQPLEAVAWFERALAMDSSNYEANWRAAGALLDWVEDADSIASADRDSSYARAERYARRAVRVDSVAVEGLFALAATLGRAALTKGKRDRLRYGNEVYQLTTTVLSRRPDHDGAHHVLGLWNAEVMRLSGFSRFFAKRLLGAKLLDQASWQSAIEHLERAVAIDSQRIAHHLDLAGVYADRKSYDSARHEIEIIERLPDRYPGDRRYRKEAQALLERIKRKERHQSEKL